MSSTSSLNFSWRSWTSAESTSSTSSTSWDWRLARVWPPSSRAICATSRWGSLSAQYLSARSIPLMSNASVGNDVRVSIDEVADRLYALEPEEFTAARDETAKKLDGDERKQVKALRKPSVAAYVVN